MSKRVNGALWVGNYFDPAFQETDRVIREARELLGNPLTAPDFDSFVVTGVSGTSVGLLLAHALGKHCLVVRKPDDNSTHDYNRCVGTLGARWVFLDDFVSTGRTQERVMDSVKEFVGKHNGTWRSMGSSQYHQAEYVGTYTYGRSGGKFAAPDGTTRQAAAHARAMGRAWV